MPLWTVAALRAGFVAALVLLAVCAPAQDQEAAAPPGREISLPSTEVKDTFFAYAMGIIARGAELELDSAQMRSMFVEFTKAMGVPFDLIARFGQHADAETEQRRITLEFTRDVVIPVPFSLLWYHPGSITATRRVGFDVRRASWTDPDPGHSVPIDDAVYDLVLVDGGIFVDIDDWLEAIFSASLEDAGITHIVFFQWRGDRLGMLAGTAERTRRVLRAYFDFTRNAIVFPVPPSLDSAGRQLVPDGPG